ncbi:tumor protein p53-inducible protein 13 [Pelodytes ibericus]
MWQLCARSVLLLVTVTSARALCDNGQLNIQMDLPGASAYLCPHTQWSFPSKVRVVSSITTRYKQESTYQACIDTQIRYTSPIPNSGVHRPKWAKYGDYIYCPPQRWVHNLKIGGVAFLYHPCVHPQLKEELSQVARSCMYKHVITPLQSLSRERPLALAAWCSTLEMSQVDLKEVKDWLQANIYREHETDNQGSYQHFLTRPSLMVSDEHDKDLCPKSNLEVSRDHFPARGPWLKKALLKKRRAVSFSSSRLLLPDTTLDEDIVQPPHNVSVMSDVQTALHTNKTQPEVPPIPEAGVTPPPVPIFEVQKPVTLVPPALSHQEVALGDPGPNNQSLQLNSHDKSHASELSAQNNVSFLRNNSDVLTESNPSFPSLENQDHISGKAEDSKEKLPSLASQGSDSSKSKQNKEFIKDAIRNADILTKEKIDHPEEPLSTIAPKSSADGIGGKEDCLCQHETKPPIAQKRSGRGQQKSSDRYLSTPRTAEATWAAASLIFLVVLLTVCVLYTQIYKKFRKSQSLYWGSRRSSQDTESVASIIKRRLIQGHSKRKKWIGRKKTPVVLYGSLSESSD